MNFRVCFLNNTNINGASIMLIASRIIDRNCSMFASDIISLETLHNSPGFATMTPVS